MPSVDLATAGSRKRARGDDKSHDTPKTKAASRVFAPFRAIGHVANHVPFDIQIRGTQFLLTTCIGRAIQTYDCAKLNLLFVSSQTEHPISVVVSQADLILVAAGPYIMAIKRGKEIWRLGSATDKDITHMITFGDNICACNADQELLVYNSSTLELHTQIALRKETEVSAMLHPATYLNKIAIATTDGRIEIWNIRTASLIHRTESFAGHITAIAGSPVIDIIAIGLLDGTIIVYHLRAAETLFTLKQEGRVTSITFRTDGTQTMATANNVGAIALWDLEKVKVQHVLRTAHASSISSIQFLNGQPILLSTGTDNAIRQWIFDASDGVPRLLKSRSGHHAPPTSIDFYGDSSQFLLSASRDRSVRAFSVYRDAQTTELSQGAVQSAANKTLAKLEDLRLPEVIGIAFQTTREKDWDNVLTAHKEDSAARSWSWSKRKLGEHELRTTDKSAVRSVAISACGNFGFVGGSKGIIDCFNMQSGQHRRTYKGDEPHTKSISGIHSDSLNKIMISTSLDGTVKFWDFHKATLISTTTIESGITATRYHKESDLLAMSCDDFCIRLLDIETKKLVRELWGHTNRISSMAFSDDGRWLISAALDGTIRTWDLPTGHLIDAIRTLSICTSLTFSPTGEYLATTHIDSVGIHLWSNKAQFSQVSTRHITEEEIVEAEMPSASGDGGAGILEIALEEQEDVKDDLLLGKFTTVDQLSDELLTLSMVPKSRWQNLLNLDVIRQRNKPKEPPKAPEKLPFDLGTLRDLQKDTGLAAPESRESEAPSSRFLDLHHASTSQFSALLESSYEDNTNHDFMAFLKTLGPAQLDIEIQSLSPVDGFREHKAFIRVITARLSARRDYELCQAYMATFFKAHSDIIAGSINDDSELEQLLLEWQKVQESERQRLADLVGYCTGVLRFLTVK